MVKCVPRYSELNNLMKDLSLSFREYHIDSYSRVPNCRRGRFLIFAFFESFLKIKINMKWIVEFWTLKFPRIKDFILYLQKFQYSSCLMPSLWLKKILDFDTLSISFVHRIAWPWLKTVLENFSYPLPPQFINNISYPHPKKIKYLSYQITV